MSYNWVYGVICGLVGGTFSTFGVNVQKFSAMKEEAKKDVEERRSYCSQPMWFIGLALVILGACLDFVALSLTAQSIVAPIGAVTLIANIFFAYFWLGEDLGRSDVIGTVLVIVGSILSIGFGNHEDKDYTMDDIRTLYGFPAFIAYAIILTVVLLCAYVGVKRLEPMRAELMLSFSKLEEAEAAGQADREGDAPEHEFPDLDLERIIDEKKAAYAPYEKLHPLLYCLLSGLFGGQSELMAKTVAVLLRTTIAGDNQFAYVLTYVFLVVMGATIALQMHFLASALKYFDALYVVPVFQCFFITGSAAGGVIFYQELKNFNVLQSVMFPVGIVVTLAGVLAMSIRDMSSKRRGSSRVAPAADDEPSSSPIALTVATPNHGPRDVPLSAIEADTP